MPRLMVRTLWPDPGNQHTDGRVCKVPGGLICMRESNDDSTSHEQQQRGHSLERTIVA